MEPEGGGAQRVALFLLPPKYKLDKDNHRVVTLGFSVQMDVNIALLCDTKIRNAFEQCETLEREVGAVKMKSAIAQVDVKFFESKDSKNPSFTMTDSIVEAIYLEWVKGTTYLYFIIERLLRETSGVSKFASEHYGNSVFAEFSRTRAATPRKLDLAPKGQVR